MLGDDTLDPNIAVEEGQVGRLLVGVVLVQVGTKKSKSMLSMLGDDTLDPNIAVEEGQVGRLSFGIGSVRVG